MTDDSEKGTFPVHILDSAKSAQSLFLSWTMWFNDVLDPQELHDALCKLLEIGDWRKLGGRLIRMKAGKLAISICKSYSADHPAIAFTHSDLLDTSIREHPLASRIAQSSHKPSIQPGPATFRVFAARKNIPITIEEIISQNAPLLSLHVTSFKDATLVALAWPHILMDAFGQQALLQSWSLVLAGRAQEVPNVLGARKDILQTVSCEEVPTEMLATPKRLQGLSLVAFLVLLLWNWLWNAPFQTKTIFLPGRVVTNLQSIAKDQILSDGGTLDPEQLSISQGDALVAWISQRIASAEPKPRPLTILTAFNARHRFSPLQESTGVYMQNMVLGAFTFLPAQLARGSLGAIALAHRRCLAEQTTVPQALGMLRLMLQTAETNDKSLLFLGSAKSNPLLYNNLGAAKITHAADFGPAILRQRDCDSLENNPLGTMVYFNFQALNYKTTMRNLVVLGKDRNGNYWINASLLPREWAEVEATIATM